MEEILMDEQQTPAPPADEGDIKVKKGTGVKGTGTVPLRNAMFLFER